MDWNKTTFAGALLQQEIERCQALVPVDYYPVAVQIGMPEYDYIGGFSSSLQIVVECPSFPSLHKPEQSEDGRLRVIAQANQLPFAKKSVNLIALPHVLDYCENPHEVLREVNAILCAQGNVIITGFNIFSLFAATNSFKRFWGGNLHLGTYYSLSRVQDWLKLLGFELVGAKMMAYQPAINSEKWRDRMDFLEKAGHRWWPGFGGVYVLVARKKEIAMGPSLRDARPWRKLVGTLAPKPQRASGAKIRLVVNNKSVQ